MLMRNKFYHYLCSAFQAKMTDTPKEIANILLFNLPRSTSISLHTSLYYLWHLLQISLVVSSLYSIPPIKAFFS